MGCKAQNAAIAVAMARLCNAADRPKRGCAAREGLVQRCLNLKTSSINFRDAAVLCPLGKDPSPTGMTDAITFTFRPVSVRRKELAYMAEETFACAFALIVN
jgi:hypothetical protein